MVTKGLFDPAVRATHMYLEGSRPSRLGDAAGWTITLLNAKDKLDASFSLAHLVPHHVVDPRKITRGAKEAQITLCGVFSSLPVFSRVRKLWIRADTLCDLCSPNSFLPAFKRLEFLTVYGKFEFSARNPRRRTHRQAHPTIKDVLEPLEEACPRLTTLVVEYLQPSLPVEHNLTCSPTYHTAAKSASGETRMYVQALVRARRGNGHPLASAVIIEREPGADGTSAPIATHTYDASGRLASVPYAPARTDGFERELDPTETEDTDSADTYAHSERSASSGHKALTGLGRQGFCRRCER